MKLGFCIILALSVFTLSLTADVPVNACNEDVLYGRCTSGSSPCTAICPDCGESFYPVPDRNGVADIQAGDCPTCGYCFGL